MADARSGRRPPRWTMQARAPITPPIAPGHGARGVCVSAPPGWGPRSCADRQEVSTCLVGLNATPSALYAQGLALA